MTPTTEAPTIELPELPLPADLLSNGMGEYNEPRFTPEQMRAYATAAVEADRAARSTREDACWVLIAPDGRQWAGDTKFAALKGELDERVPHDQQQANIRKAVEVEMAELKALESNARDAARYRFWRKFYRSAFAIAGRGILSFRPSRPALEIAGPQYEQAVDSAIDAAIAARERQAGGEGA